MKMLINSIYLATEGEGVHLGTPQIFIRFQGCSVGCLNCDSKYTWDFDQKFAMDWETIKSTVDELSQGKIKRISITGGDPLAPKHIPAVELMVGHYKNKGFYINIEASGTRIIDTLFDRVDYISFDFKTPSTGVSTHFDFLVRLNEQYPKNHQIKSVISDEKDFNFVLAAHQELLNKVKNPILWCLTPANTPGDKFNLRRFDEILQWNVQNGALFRVIGQQHKWVYGSDKEQV